MSRKRFDDGPAAAAFILGGNARVTLVSRVSGARFTYQVRASDDGQVFFVKVLTGPDNTSTYSYLGFIRDGSYRHGGSKSRIGENAHSAKAWAWAWHQLSTYQRIPKHLEVWHEGRCGRCARVLTVPESIASGFGPVCVGRAA